MKNLKRIIVFIVLVCLVGCVKDDGKVKDPVDNTPIETPSKPSEDEQSKEPPVTKIASYEVSHLLDITEMGVENPYRITLHDRSNDLLLFTEIENYGGQAYMTKRLFTYNLTTKKVENVKTFSVPEAVRQAQFYMDGVVYSKHSLSATDLRQGAIFEFQVNFIDSAKVEKIIDKGYITHIILEAELPNLHIAGDTLTYTYSNAKYDKNTMTLVGYDQKVKQYNGKDLVVLFESNLIESNPDSMNRKNKMSYWHWSDNTGRFGFYMPIDGGKTDIYYMDNNKILKTTVDYEVNNMTVLDNFIVFVHNSSGGNGRAFKLLNTTTNEITNYKYDTGCPYYLNKDTAIQIGDDLSLIEVGDNGGTLSTSVKSVLRMSDRTWFYLSTNENKGLIFDSQNYYEINITLK